MASSYDNMDTRVLSGEAGSFFTQYGTAAPADVAQSIINQRSNQDFTNLQASVGAAMQQMYAEKETSVKNTHLLAQMNEAWNSNNYIVTNLKREQARVAALNRQSKRDMYRAREMHMHAKNSLKRYQRYTNVLMFTLVSLAALLILVAVWRQGHISTFMLGAFGAPLLLLYLAIMLIIVARDASRRARAWDQYYWRYAKSDTQDLAANVR